ncbi:MAG: ATP-binding protein [Cyanobacteriota bacterium]
MVVQAEAERCQVSVLTRGLEQPAACVGDRDQLQRMVLNLLRNCIEAVPSGGQVELRLEQRASGLRLEVADNGPGFPASTLAAAGLPIASSKQRGFGLGLYLVRRAVANNDGQLLLGRSDLGGASAQVLLPVAGPSGRSLRRSAPTGPEP